MKMAAIYLKPVAVVLIPLIFLLPSSCATTPAEQAADWEPWAGELTGMVDADLKLFFARVAEAENVHMVKGSFEGDIGRVAGGYGSGTMKGVIKGKVKDGIFNVRMRGRATVTEGSAAVTGKLVGTLSKTQAFGTWKIEAQDSEDTYHFSGEWSAQKTDTASQGS